jgi:hypothetical protein
MITTWNEPKRNVPLSKLISKPIEKEPQVPMAEKLAVAVDAIRW